MDDRERLAELSRLRDATPVDSPEYEEIQREYRELSDKMERGE